MRITATLINLYHVCHRETWLHANGITMEHNSDVVADGKLLHETSYPQRAEKRKEISISATLQDGTVLMGQMDFYDPSTKTVHETKRSDKVETAHEWQSKFYLWLLQLNGLDAEKAILDYPKQRETKTIFLSLEDKNYLQNLVLKIAALVQSEHCPPVLNRPICKKCSYYDLCYVGD